jgi:DMSO/TMAO reductase YedYZ molybdopterin-dependent catalytic subunit
MTICMQARCRAFIPVCPDFRVFGLVEEPLRLSWQEFSNLPQSQILADMHCVRHWSRFDNHWGGLLATELMKGVKLRPEARHGCRETRSCSKNYRPD